MNKYIFRNSLVAGFQKHIWFYNEILFTTRYTWEETELRFKFMSFDDQHFLHYFKCRHCLNTLTFKVNLLIWYPSKGAMWQTEYGYVTYYYICIIGGDKNWVWFSAFKSSGTTTENFYINRLYLKIEVWESLFKHRWTYIFINNLWTRGPKLSLVFWVLFTIWTFFWIHNFSYYVSRSM